MRTRLKPGTIDRARTLRAYATDAERKLWYALCELKRLGFHFRRQAPFRSYILDFVEHSAKIVVELDGSQHGEDRHRIRDKIRDGILISEGYRVLRFWNSDVLANRNDVVEFVLAALAVAPHPGGEVARPPHKGEVH